MRTICIALLLAGLAAAQDSRSNTYVYDVNGNRVLFLERAAGDNSSSEKVQSVNGRSVPLEKVEEKVLEKDSTRMVLERTIKRYDPNGNPLPPERIRVETTMRSDGGAETRTSIYRGDLNGNLKLSERSVSDTSSAGGVTENQVRVERPTVNGSFEVVEKKVGQSRDSGDKREQDVTVYQRDDNGRFIPVSRQITKSTKDGPTVVDEYQSAATGEMQLSREVVTKVVKGATGDKQEVSIYGLEAPGRPAGGSLKLREQHLIETRPTPEGAVQTFSVRRPSLSSDKELGQYQRVSETVCKGKCNP
jgi:hypothetical protein